MDTETLQKNQAAESGHYSGGDDELSYEINIDAPPPTTEPVEQPDENVEIENPLSSVASAPAKNIVIMAVFAVISVIFIYKIIFADTEKTPEQQEVEIEEDIQSPPIEAAIRIPTQENVPQANIGIVKAPVLPSIDDDLPLPDIPLEAENIEQINEPPPPPSALPAPPSAPVVPTQVIQKTAAPTVAQPKVIDNSKAEEELFQKEMSRRKTSMLLINGGGTPQALENSDGQADGSIGPSPAPQAEATKVEDLSRMILQGKMIEAILETTINTDLPGSLRAIISRDIYAEAGRNILIPKGSRLLGTYSSGVQPGQRRVSIIWTRIIRPDGIDIQVDSEGTDQLGRTGMTGIVDNKYYEMFSNSLLTSMLTIGGSIALSGVEESQGVSTSTTTSGSDTTTTQTATPTDTAVLQAVESLSEIATNIADSQSTTPTIIVNQGSRVRVFVNKDLIFPKEAVIQSDSLN